MNSDDINTSYNTIKENPVLLARLIDKYIQVSTIKNRSYIGFVHSIDPVTHSLILLTPQEDVYQTILIPGHAILDVTEALLPADTKLLQRKKIKSYSNEELKERKNKLIAWFKTNLLPVVQLDDKIHVGNVSVLPPYTSFDLYTENPIIALQIKRIMHQMPDDFRV